MKNDEPLYNDSTTDLGDGNVVFIDFRAKGIFDTMCNEIAPCFRVIMSD